MNISIVTDSTADIPESLAEEQGIYVIPNRIMIDGQSLIDGKEISRKEFYKRMPAMKTPPTTGTAASGVYQDLYEKLLIEGAQQVLSIHAASTLSGIINAASTAAQSFGERIHVFDSLSVTLGLGFQVLEAVKAVRQGATIPTLLCLLENLRPRSRVVAMLDTLEYIHRSGRISWARARLGNLLNLKPFVELRNGVVHSIGETRTRKKGVERLAQQLKEIGILERMAILHTNAEADANQFLSNLDVILPEQPMVVNVTPVIGTHVGPNGLGFAAILQD